MADIDSWVEAQEFQITLDAEGRIIDYLDNEVKRPNTPEEHIRQKMIQIITLGRRSTYVRIQLPIRVEYIGSFAFGNQSNISLIIAGTSGCIIYTTISARFNSLPILITLSTPI